MTQIQQQRLIGALLLVSIFSGIAYFLMSSANQTEEVITNPSELEQDFTSSIDVISDGDIEVISSESEALIDPHNLKSEEVITLIHKETAKPVIPKEIEKEIAVSEFQESSTPSADSWFLQLASFSIEKNAQGLQKQVSLLGYTANIQSSIGEKGTIYRVRIGPENSRLTLEKISLILNKELELKSQIIKNTNK